MSKQSSHTHKFKRLRFKSGNEVFFCVDADCNKKLNISLALGKRSICWRCGQPFILSEYSLRLAKPHCDNCHKPKGVIKEDINDLRVIKEHNEEIIHELSLAERLQQTIHSAQSAQQEEDEI